MPSSADRRRRPALSLALAATILAAGFGGASGPAGAVIILDSTWRTEGGTKARPEGGFGAHLRLAAEPQFKAVVAFASDGETWGEASGTWIGNDDRYGYVLTAAHVFDLPAQTDSYVIRSPGGTIHHIDRIWTPPEWDGDTDAHTGYDIAILRLTKPMTDAGPAPLLYAGSGEEGQLLTFVGFGSRGIGSRGQQDEFYTGSDKAAAQGTVDVCADLDRATAAADATADAGGYLGVFLGREDGSIENPYGGSAKPPTPLAGLLGSGDSGGSAWMKVGGTWTIVGINSNGSGEATYGESSWFARVGPHRDWIAGIFPGARFTQ